MLSLPKHLGGMGGMLSPIPRDVFELWTATAKACEPAMTSLAAPCFRRVVRGSLVWRGIGEKHTTHQDTRLSI